jgi:hypothetical protein
MMILIFYGITIAMVKINILQYLHISATSQESFLTAVVASYKVDDAQRDSWEVENKWRYSYNMVRNTFAMLFLRCCFFLELKVKPANDVRMYKHEAGSCPTGHAYIQ